MKTLLIFLLLTACCPRPAEIPCIAASASRDCRVIDLDRL